MLRGDLQRDGFVHIRGFFPPDELRKIRWSLDAAAKGQSIVSLAYAPGVAHAILGGRVLTLAQELLGAEPIGFFDHSLNINGGYGTFHKDNVDRRDANGPDWSLDPFPVIRFGIYLEDYSHHSGSVAVQPGSHRGVRYADKAVNVRTQPGDLVAWYLTTTHAAGSPAYRWAPSSVITSPVNYRRAVKAAGVAVKHLSGGRLGRIIAQPIHPTRRAVFFSYASCPETLARYLSLLLHRCYYRSWLTDDPLHGEPPEPVGIRWMNPMPFLGNADPELIAEGFYQSKASAAADLLADDILTSFGGGYDAAPVRTQ